MAQGYPLGVRAVMVEVPLHLLEERRRLGQDRRDEMWEGVLHMVPAPAGRHQLLNARLVAALLPLAEARGLLALVEAGLLRPGAVETSYRVPDSVIARPEHYSPDHGIIGPAELVVELRSPGDETTEKLPFYAELGCREVLVLDPRTAGVELYALRQSSMEPVPPAADGSFTLASLDVRVTPAHGPAFDLAW